MPSTNKKYNRKKKGRKKEQAPKTLSRGVQHTGEKKDGESHSFGPTLRRINQEKAMLWQGLSVVCLGRVTGLLGTKDHKPSLIFEDGRHLVRKLTEY